MLPEFRDAVRHALFCERAAQVMGEYEDVLGISEDNVTDKGKAQLVRAKIDARAAIDDIHEMMVPTDG